MSAMSLDSSAAAALVAAAAGAVGPCPAETAARAEWERLVGDAAFGLLRLVPAVMERAEVLAACSPVTGVITAVDEVSGRGKITIRPTMGSGDGKPEDFRTAWLSEREGRAMTTLARSLVGRHCRFGKRLESTKSGQRKVRMCEWIEDLGPDPVAAGSVEEPTRPIAPPEHALASPAWAQRFAKAVRAAGHSDAVRAAIVERATQGRTRSPRAVRAAEIDAVRDTFRAVSEGRLTMSTVKGAAVLVETPAEAAA